jgi:hypothetical protein
MISETSGTIYLKTLYVFQGELNLISREEPVDLPKMLNRAFK